MNKRALLSLSLLLIFFVTDRTQNLQNSTCNYFLYTQLSNNHFKLIYQQINIIFSLKLSKIIKYYQKLSKIIVNNIKKISSDIWKSIKFDNECHIDVDIEWEASLGGYTLSTPIIGDFRNDGRKEIILATYGEYVEAIDGEDGEKEPGK